MTFVMVVGSLLAIIGGCCLVTALVGVVQGANDGLRARQLRRTPDVTAAGVPAGRRVAVRGTTAPGPAGPLRSPLTDLPCVWWSVRVTRVDRGEDADVRHVVVDLDSGAPFALVDPTGSVLVDGRLAAGSAPSRAGPRVWQPMADVNVSGGGSYVVDRLVAAGLVGAAAVRARRRTRRFEVHEALLPAGREATAIGRLHRHRGGPVLRRRGHDLAGLRPETRTDLLSLLDGERRQGLVAAVTMVVMGAGLLGAGWIVLAAGAPRP